MIILIYRSLYLHTVQLQQLTISYNGNSLRKLGNLWGNGSITHVRYTLVNRKISSSECMRYHNLQVSQEALQCIPQVYIFNVFLYLPLCPHAIVWAPMRATLPQQRMREHVRDCHSPGQGIPRSSSKRRVAPGKRMGGRLCSPASAHATNIPANCLDMLLPTGFQSQTYHGVNQGRLLVATTHTHTHNKVIGFWKNAEYYLYTFCTIASYIQFLHLFDDIGSDFRKILTIIGNK